MLATYCPNIRHSFRVLKVTVSTCWKWLAIAIYAVHRKVCQYFQNGGEKYLGRSRYTRPPMDCKQLWPITGERNLTHLPVNGNGWPIIGEKGWFNVIPAIILSFTLLPSIPTTLSLPTSQISLSLSFSRSLARHLPPILSKANVASLPGERKNELRDPWKPYLAKVMTEVRVDDAFHAFRKRWKWRPLSAVAINTGWRGVAGSRDGKRRLSFVRRFVDDNIGRRLNFDGRSSLILLYGFAIRLTGTK